MSDIVLLIFLMSLVTFIPRVLPILLLTRCSLPAVVERWLSYIPVAVLAALLAPALFTSEGSLNFTFNINPAFWISIPVFIIAIYTRNLFMTVILGMAFMALARLLFI